MSNYEGMNGNGYVMKKDLKVLKSRLIDAHNRQIAGMKPKMLKQDGLKKATIRTTAFPIFNKRDDEVVMVGGISLNPAEGKFVFSIGENNHAMDDAEQSLAFQALSRFMASLPNKGKTYGARTYYWSEYDEDEYGNRGPGSYRYYGAWSQNGWG